jgi:hypothetical protein|tara:strand:- start:2505 stop:3029 length:525 start_codon:yes stop_codon:yes gene_type:complete
MANIADFKSKLAGGGARTNQFKVTCPFPGYSQQGGEIETMAFLCKGAELPASSVGETNITFRGRTVKFAGERTYADMTLTVINDTDFKIRNAMERWQNGINNHTDNEGLTNPADYQVDMFIDQLDRNGSTIKSYTLRGAYPGEVSNITLNYDTDSIEEFTVTMRYQYFESNTTT